MHYTVEWRLLSNWKARAACMTATEELAESRV
jgi:hypothetical protein